MQVILFRHGPAGRRDSRRWPDDALRPLTARGRERTRRAARGLGTLLARQPLVFTSPFKRARQTADILADELLVTAITPEAALEPGASPARLLQHLAKAKSDQCVVMVGHEPDLGALAGSLLTGRKTALPLKKSGACAIHFVGPVEPGAGRLDWFLTPRVLRRVGRRAGKRVAK
jgi:phosphohistidine phosphatase